jgi:hypothetical protein
MGVPEEVIRTYRTWVVDPVRVFFDGERSSSHYELALPWGRSENGSDVGQSTLWLTKSSIEKWAGRLEEGFANAGAAFDYEGQQFDLAFGWMVAHELGHGLADAHSLTYRIPYELEDGEKRWRYPNLPQEVLSRDPDQKLLPDIGDSTVVEDERQAEGVGTLFLKKVLAEQGMSQEDAERVSTAVHETFRKDADTIRERVAAQDGARYYFYGGNKDVPLNRLGYAYPLLERQLVERFSLVPGA